MLMWLESVATGKEAKPGRSKGNLSPDNHGSFQTRQLHITPLKTGSKEEVHLT